MPPALHSVEELERQARGTGLAAAMAKAQLRMCSEEFRARNFAASSYGQEDPAPEALSAGGVEPKDAVGDGGSEILPPPCCEAPTRLQAPPRGRVSSALVDRSMRHWPGRAAMFEPPPVAASPEELVSREVQAIEAELVRVDSRLRSLAWCASPPRARVAETWAEISLGVAPDRQSDGDQVARTALEGKRAALLHRLSELRARLTGSAGDSGRRGRWG